MKVKDLAAHPRNPRRISAEQLDALKKSLETFGDLGGIVWNQETGTTVGGHQRLKNAKPGDDVVIEKKFDPPTKQGTVAEGYIVIAGERHKYRQVSWDETTEKAAMLAANKHGGEWDMALLPDLLLELDTANIDMDLTGFLEEELAAMMAPINKEGLTDDDAVPEPPAEPKSKLGDLWTLGNHRLLCGDSTNVQHVERLMDGQKADMVFTDPPYNVDYSNADRPKASKTDLGSIKNDKMGDGEFLDFLISVFSNLAIYTKDDASLYMFFAGTTVEFYQAISQSAFAFNQLLIWKKPMLLGRSRYQWAHEPCLFGIKGKPHFTDDRTKTSVWDFGGYDKSNNVHPTQKPIVVPSEAINNSSLPGDYVLDLFGGSGSTLIACEKTGRQCFMMELDPKYVDVIIKRWCDFTGQDAVRDDGVKWSELQ